MRPDIQEVSFDRPPAYWLKRAQKYRDLGDMRNASALLRHVTRQEPDNVELLGLFSATLHQLGCYQAAKREAVAALARRPAFFPLYGMVARNLSRLGYHQEALDAYSLFLLHGRVASRDFDPYDYDCEITENYRRRAPRAARLRGLQTIAARRIASGDLDTAEKLLEKLQRDRYTCMSQRYLLLYARYELLRGDTAAARRYATEACHNAPRNVGFLCELAQLMVAKPLCMRKQARALALRAMLLARSVVSESLACTTMAATGQARLMCKILAARQKHAPNRLSTCYDLSLALLWTGDLKRASCFAHLSRELDAEDLCAEALLKHVVELNDNDAPIQSVKALARALPFYGALAPADSERMIRQMEVDFNLGQTPFARRVYREPMVHRRYLALLTLPNSRLERTLPLAANHWPKAFYELFLRELLLTAPADRTMQARALQRLLDIGAKPPFAVWRPGRLLNVDPTQPPPAEPGFMQRMLVRRVRQAAKRVHARGFVPEALKLIKGMTHHQRCLLAGNHGGDWPFAFAMCVCALGGVSAPIKADLFALDSERLMQLQQRCAALKPHQEGE